MNEAHENNRRQLLASQKLTSQQHADIALAAWRKQRQAGIAPEDRVLPPSSEEKRITVCDNCLQASCWHGEFMCDEARTAGITIKTVAELRKLNLEHPSYWS